MALNPARQFFVLPLEYVEATVASLASATRGLRDPQLESEIADLCQMRAAMRDPIAIDLVLAMYDRERRRRGDPAMMLEDELDAALSRLERQTSEADRQRVSDIGLQIVEIGGLDALRDAYRRMVHGRPTAELRGNILQRRWQAVTSRGVT